MAEYTKAQIEVLRETIPQRKDCDVFLHCKTCIPSKLPPDMSPEQFGSYELASCSIEISKSKRVHVLTAWCKHCGKLVWDSRHLTHAY